MDVAFVTGGSGFVGRNLIEALVARGYVVRALVRSPAAAATVSGLGAVPVEGELHEPASYVAHVRGASVLFHVAAKADDWGRWNEFVRANVAGTEGALEAARAAGVPRFVHVGTEAALLGASARVRDADETLPLPARTIGLYPRSKAMAERLVVAANGPDLTTVVVRPRFVWGRGDTSLLPKLVAAVKEGRFAWIGGGRHLTSTTHVRNVVEALLLAAGSGRGGEVYFATDGAPVEFRAFVTDLLQTQGVQPGDRTVPFWAAHAFAYVTTGLWTALGLRSAPPMTHTAVHLIGEEVTVRDDKIRRELGYRGTVSRAQGLAEMTT